MAKISYKDAKIAGQESTIIRLEAEVKKLTKLLDEGGELLEGTIVGYDAEIDRLMKVQGSLVELSDEKQKTIAMLQAEVKRQTD